MFVSVTLYARQGAFVTLEYHAGLTVFQAAYAHQGAFVTLVFRVCPIVSHACDTEVVAPLLNTIRCLPSLILTGAYASSFFIREREKELPPLTSYEKLLSNDHLPHCNKNLIDNL